METLLINNIEYTLPLDKAQCIIWTIQSNRGKDAAMDWMYDHLARFN